jgi:predicted transcriptional regulator
MTREIVEIPPLNDELIRRVLDHFKRFGADYPKSLGRDLEMNKRVACALLKKLYEMGYLEKRASGMLKRKEAKLKRRVTTHPHHTYYVLSGKGRAFLEGKERFSV